MKPDPFKDKVIIVTGGASGIGQALCVALGKRKAGMIIVADIDGAKGQLVAQSILAAGGQSEAAELDVTQAASVENLIRRIATKYGSLDYMFNNAGISISGEAQDMTLTHWQRQIDVSLWGVIYGTKAAYAVMLKQGNGHIINVSSASGLVPIPMGLPYSTAKHGVVGLSTALRIEAAANGIYVSVVCPGVIRTPLLDTSEVVTPYDRDKLLDSPMHRTMEPEDCVRIILKGVACNKAIITVTTETRILWWLHRFNPALMGIIGRMIIRKFRELSTDSPPKGSSS